MNNNQLLISEVPLLSGKLGKITLNRPEALNALSMTMIELFNDQIKQWESDSSVVAVLIQGEGERAFCAGGDVKAIYDIGREDLLESMHFFSEEYQLNRRIHHFPKPYIAFMHGICMGGGVGVSVNGRYRVAASDLRLAMPETKIGFYPDVGATFFLSHCPGELGTYIGLTGNEISAADALYAGLIDFIVEKNEFPAIVSALTELNSWSNADIQKTLGKFSINHTTSFIATKRNVIDECFSQDTIQLIMNALSQNNDPWCQEIHNNLLARSPTSLKLTLEALRKAKNQSFNECMAMEFGMTEKMLGLPDFFEGVRAVIVDKDNTPHWNPSGLDN